MESSTNSHNKELFEVLFKLKGEPNNEDYLSKIDPLLNEVTDINAVDKDGGTLLHHVAYIGNTKLLKMLFSRADAIWLENQKKKSLFQRIFTRSSDKRIDLNAISKDGFMPLHIAAYCGHKDIVEMLLKRGVKMNKKDKDGRTPVIVAIYGGRKDILDMLLKRGANINAKDEYGRNVVQIAIIGKKIGMAEMLLNKGFDQDLEDKRSKFLLYRAVIKPIINKIKILLGKRIDINTHTEYGENILHTSIKNGAIDITKKILVRMRSMDNDKEFKECINAQDGSGKSALDLAQKLSDKSIFDILSKELGSIADKEAKRSTKVAEETAKTLGEATREPSRVTKRARSSSVAK